MTEEAKLGEFQDAKIKVGWIYELSKEQLILEAEKLKLDTTGTVDELRKRMTTYYKTKHKSEENVEKSLRAEIDSLQLRIQQISKANLTPSASIQQISVDGAAGSSPCDSRETQIANMNQVRKWNVRFNGRSDAVEFYERIEELMNSYKIPECDMLQALPEMMKDSALEWYRNNKNNWEKWSDFLEDFKAHFFPRQYTYYLEEQIRTRKQGENEPVRDYVTAIQTLLRRQGHLSLNECLDRIYNNLLPRYRLHIRRKDFTTLAELLNSAQEFQILSQEAKNEERRRTYNTYSPTFRSQRTNETLEREAHQRTAAYNPKTFCYRCREEGHFRKSCAKPFKRFCSQCGRNGVLTRDCCLKPQGNFTTPVQN